MNQRRWSARAPADRGSDVTVSTRYGAVVISWAACGLLLAEIRSRGSGDFVIRVLDALWGLSESADADPQLSELQDKLRDEITAS